MGRVLWPVLLVVALVLVWVTPVYAVADPDSISIESVRVFQNLWNGGDQLYLVEYKAMYASDPSEDAEDTFLVGLWLGSGQKYSKPISYYDHHIVSIYLEPGQALTWEGGYSIKVAGNPSYFSPLVEGTNLVTLALSGGHWVSGDQETSRGYLEDWVGALAETLEDSWGSDLLTSTGKLNATGAVVFKGAVPGLDGICPDVFAVPVYYPEYEESSEYEVPYYSRLIARSGVTNPLLVIGSSGVGSASLVVGKAYRFYGEVLEEKIGARFRGALDDLGDWMHVPGLLIGGVGLGVLYFVLAGRVFLATGSTSAAVAISFPFILAGNLIGLIPLAITFTVGMVVLVLFGITFILARMGA